MKKIVVLFLTFIFIFNCGDVFARDSKTKLPSIKFEGVSYTLYYSAKSKELNGYINEYYKSRENYANWTELVALHHYPNSFYPIDHAKDFMLFLENSGSIVSIEENDKDNSAILDCIIINKSRLPIILEYNIFKYVKSPVCGTVGLQYARRYRINNALDVEKVIKSINKSKKKNIKAINKIKIPNVITSEIDKGVYVTSESEQNKQEETKVETPASDDSKDISVEQNDSDKKDIQEEIEASTEEKTGEHTEEDLQENNTDNSESISED